MFEFITNPEERGQVGIGTLIVFIAMVLVAAIAAGVLINTAGFLQTQAEATGQESTDLVSERIDVTSEVGIVTNTPDDGELDEIRLTITGAPGADDIDVGDTTIQAVGPGGQENMVFAPGGTVDTSYDDALSTEDIDAQQQVDVGASDIKVSLGGGIASSEFGATTEILIEGTSATTSQDLSSDQSGSVVDVTIPGGVDLSSNDQIQVTFSGENGLTLTDTVTVVDLITDSSELTGSQFAVSQDGSLQETAVLSEENQYQILLNPQEGALRNTDNNNNRFGQGDSATLDIVSPAGATTSVELRAPDLFTSNNEAVRL